MIVETIVTTLDERGRINFAPMGVEWGEEEIVLKPFLETTTFRNLEQRRSAVVNLTDDVMLFAEAAIGSPQYPSIPASVVQGVVLESACSWRELVVESVDATPPRSRTRSWRPGATRASWSGGAPATTCPGRWRRLLPL